MLYEGKIRQDWRTPMRVDFIRVKNDMPMETFSNKFEITQTELDSAMDGRLEFRESSLMAIAKFFGLTIGQVVGTEPV